MPHRKNATPVVSVTPTDAPADARPTAKERRVSPAEAVRRRIQKWEDEDPSSLLTKRVEKITSPLHQLVTLLMPERLLQETLSRTLWAAEALTDRNDVLKALGVGQLDEIRARSKIDQCDAVADQTQFWAVGAAAALGAWDVVGPLGLAPALASLFTLSFRTIKKIGLCFGFDTSSHTEELIALEVFVAASTLYHREKVSALKEIEKIVASSRDQASPLVTRESVEARIVELASAVTNNFTRRRTFANVPALGAIVGSSTNAWIVQDVCWAARNIYASRFLELKKAQRLEATEQRKAAKAAQAATQDELPKAA